MKRIILALALIFSVSSLAAPKKKATKEETGTTVINHDMVKQLKELLSLAEKGEVYQTFIVTTGKNGVGYSYNLTKEGELILIGGIEWAKNHLVNEFDKKQEKSK